MASNDRINWKQLGIHALCHVPVILGVYTYWYFENYWRLGSFGPNYRRVAGSSEDKAERTQYFAKNANKKLHYRIVDLDGALMLQQELVMQLKPEVVTIKHLGPPLRIDCSFARFVEFEEALTRGFGSETDDERAAAGPLITFYGSNDYHHLTLGLVRRFRQPFNLVLFDNHPDWVERYPGLHCGSWFNHCCTLPTTQQAFHFGGYSGEFEDTAQAFDPLEPSHFRKDSVRAFLGFSSITFDAQTYKSVGPASGEFKGMKWGQVKQTPLRPVWHKFITRERIREILAPYAETLKAYPLYITLDKDVMLRSENLQNWNSGILTRDEVILIIEELIAMSGGRLLAMDITGDFSKVETEGWYRSYLHHSQHEEENNNIDPEQAAFLNERTNRAVLKAVAGACGLTSDV